MDITFFRGSLTNNDKGVVRHGLNRSHDWKLLLHRLRILPFHHQLGQNDGRLLIWDWSFELYLAYCSRAIVVVRHVERRLVRVVISVSWFGQECHELLLLEELSHAKGGEPAPLFEQFEKGFIAGRFEVVGSLMRMVLLFLLAFSFLFEFLEGTEGLFPEDGFMTGLFLFGSEDEMDVFEDVLLLKILSTANNWDDNTIGR